MSQEAKTKLHIVSGTIDDEKYIIGVYEKLGDAQLAADIEKIWHQAWKISELHISYETIYLNHYDAEKLNYYNEFMW